MRNSKTRKSPPSLRPNEFAMSYAGQLLRRPDDMDLFREIDAGRLPLAAAIKRVAVRRQLEREWAEIERQECERGQP